MKRPVALVYPYFSERDPVRKLFPPLGLAYLASQLTAAGIPVRVCDCTFGKAPEVIDEVAADDPSIVGMYVMISMSRNALEILAGLRPRLRDTLFTTGGPLPTVYPDRFAGAFDLVFRGEADLTFARFCRDYIDAGCVPGALHRLPLTRYPGLYRRSNGSTISVPPVHNRAEVLNTLPLPDRSGFDHRRYQQHWQETDGCRQTNIIITRGCPYSCDFCSKPVWGNVYRKPSLERVLSEIRAVEDLGYDRLWIADDSFTLDLAYLRAFCREKIRRGIGITWTCLSRVDRISDELAALMRRAGCVRVYLGLESGSDATLVLMKKRTTVADGVRAVRIYRNADIRTAGFFIVGYPGETVDSIEATLTHALTLPLDEISINVPVPLPGSPLFERTSDVDTGSDWDCANEVHFLYRSEFDQEWLRRRIEETMERFREKKKAARKERVPPGSRGR
jgi:anaerobic magnesium-protoporphyrin IX monomethyl ester cyclase